MKVLVQVYIRFANSKNPFSVAFRVAARIVPVGSRCCNIHVCTVLQNKKYSTVSKSPAIPLPSRKGRTVRRKEPHYPHIVRTWAPTHTRAKKGQCRYCMHGAQRSPSTTSTTAHHIYSSRNAQVRPSQRAFRVSRSPARHVSSSRAKNLLDDSDVSRVLPVRREHKEHVTLARLSPVPRAGRSAGLCCTVLQYAASWVRCVYAVQCVRPKGDVPFPTIASELVAPPASSPATNSAHISYLPAYHNLEFHTAYRWPRYSKMD